MCVDAQLFRLYCGPAGRSYIIYGGGIGNNVIIRYGGLVIKWPFLALYILCTSPRLTEKTFEHS